MTLAILHPKGVRLKASQTFSIKLLHHIFSLPVAGLAGYSPVPKGIVSGEMLPKQHVHLHAHGVLPLLSLSG